MNKLRKLFLAGLCALVYVAVVSAQTYDMTNNLLKNGSFDDPEDPLNHWIYAFDHNKHYLNNYKYVSVVDDPASMRKGVLRLDATIHDVCINQGVQVYSAPIRFDPKKKYKISLSARSVGTTGGLGPKCRIYAIGYRWHPKAVKSNNPAFGDLREAVRFQPIYFNSADTGEFSHVPKQWKRVERVIPTPGRSELQQSHLENCDWLMLKILALDWTGVNKCNTGYLFVDDIKIEEIGLADNVNITKGAATKGFDGKAWSGSNDGKKPFVPIGGPQPVRKK
ncbi:MAG: hypothetical protein PHU80_11955 [Kiritimatiellae bacterium]|nr:hypothetical protein [Kiritimatiellia bacterium]